MPNNGFTIRGSMVPVLVAAPKGLSVLTFPKPNPVVPFCASDENPKLGDPPEPPKVPNEGTSDPDPNTAGLAPEPNTFEDEFGMVLAMEELVIAVGFDPPDKENDPVFALESPKAGDD